MFKETMERSWVDRELCFYTNIIVFISIFNITQGVLSNLRIVTPLGFDDTYLYLIYSFFNETEFYFINVIRDSKNIYLYQIINTFFFKLSSLFDINFNKFYSDKNYISDYFLGISLETYKEKFIECTFNTTVDYKIKNYGIDSLPSSKDILYKLISMCKEYTKQKLTLPILNGIKRSCESSSYYIKQRCK